MQQGGNQNQNSDSNKQSASKSSKMKNVQNVKFSDEPSSSQHPPSGLEGLYTPPIDGVRQRGFIGLNIRPQPMFINTSSQNDKVNNLVQSSGDSTSSTQVYWGTNINFDETWTKFRQFILDFKPENDFTQNENYYHRMLREIKETKIYFLNIDGEHLKKFDQMLYWQLIHFPTEMIPLLDIVANKVYNEIINNNQPEENKRNQIQIRISNLTNKSRIRDLGPNDIDKLISITGIVIRTSEIIPEMREGYFRCTVCGKVEKSGLQRSAITEPIDCPICKVKSSFELIHNLSIYNDKQHIKIQETPETMPEGETPVTIHLCGYDELVDYTKPGDRCEFVGIFRAQGIRVNPRQRVTKTTFRTYVDIVSITKSNKLRMNVDNDKEDVNSMELDYETNELNEIENENIRNEVEKLKKSKDIYNILVDSLAPSIWENEDVKKGWLLQLFGGISKDFSAAGQGKFRGDINILMVGDPSTAKSQLLQYVHNLAPRGIYTSGKGSSVVGLTAYITKDPETRELILESGALVLSDKGICCIDEFDKMDDSTKVILHEAMEQQTISIAKAGIICQLNARAAILASANPIHSRYDPKWSVVQNIRLPPSLLSRFDLIYLMLDKHNETSDRRLASHIVSLYGNIEDEDTETNKFNIKESGKKSGKKSVKKQPEPETKVVSKEVLTAYISQARNLNPKLTDEIVNELTRIYIEMRQMSSGKNTISATPRQLESLIRLSEARARLRFSSTVDKEDVDEAIRLIKVATQQAATDPITGVIDMDMLTTGYTASTRIKIDKLIEVVKSLLRDYAETARKGVKYSSLFDEVKKIIDDKGQNSFQFNDNDFKDVLRKLEDEEFISLLGNKRAPIIRWIAINI